MNQHQASAALLPLTLLVACAAPSPRALRTGPGLELATVARPAIQKGGSLAPVAGERRAAVGIGITDSPDTFLFSGSADFYQSDRLAIGPALQLGFGDDQELIAPTFRVKFVFPIERSGASAQFLPFVTGGAGFAYLQKDRPGDDDEAGLMLEGGGGLEVRFDEDYALASTVLLHGMPAELIDERSFVSWQIVEFSFRF